MCRQEKKSDLVWTTDISINKQNFERSLQYSIYFNS